MLKNLFYIVLILSFMNSCNDNSFNSENKVTYMYDVLKVSAGRSFNLALKSDGTVWAWGYNGFGVLGVDPDSIQIQNKAFQLKYLNNIIDIKAGYNHCLAVSLDGSVYTWGANYFGQLGIGRTNQYEFVPQKIQIPVEMKTIAAGHDFSIAVASDGSVYSWGRNYHGSLGIGDYEEKLSPANIVGLSSISKVSTWSWSCIALDINGNVYTWGDNTFMQLGRIPRPAYFMDPNPVYVENLPIIAEISSGNRTYVVTDKNQVIQFGYTNTILSDLNNVIKIASSEDHHLAIKTDYSLLAWGKNNYGQLGNGQNSDISLNEQPPTDVLLINDVIEIDAGESHSIAVKNDGTVWTWGLNEVGQLGNDTLIDSNIPVKVQISE